MHCASGYRAGIAASLLQRAGRDVVHIDARFADAAAAGIALDEAGGRLPADSRTAGETLAAPARDSLAEYEHAHSYWRGTG